MAHLLHIDSSIRVDGSVTRALSAFIPLAHKSRADAERAVDELWRPAAMAA